MEGSPESGIDFKILRLTRCPTEEEYGQARRMSVEKEKFPHIRWVYLSTDRRGGNGQILVSKLKMAVKVRIRITPGLQVVVK